MSENVHFERADIAAFLQTLSPEQRDALEFGIIEMNRGGAVTFYNRFEEQLAGLSRDDVLGRDFFVDIAPCTNNFMVRERFVAAWEGGLELDTVIPYTFSYRMKATKVRLRMLVRNERSWLLVDVPA